MNLADRIKPISYLQAHAAEIIRDIHKSAEPLIITQNGEAKAIVQDIHSYEQTQETLALLKILALAEREIEEGKTIPAAEAMRLVRERIRGR
jgi:prevent-host-death family protein